MWLKPNSLVSSMGVPSWNQTIFKPIKDIKGNWCTFGLRIGPNQVQTEPNHILVSNWHKPSSNWVWIEPVPAIGIGSLTIHVLNSSSQSTIIHLEVLHALTVGYTLMSISALDQKGYCTSIGSRHLEPFRPGGQCVMCVPQTTQGLYHITHLGESAHAVETISVMELHHCLGHIMPISICALVKKGLVTEVKLNLDS